LYVVADGMGGHAAGEVASRIAVEEIERVLLDTRDDEDWTWPDSFDQSISLVANKLKYAINLANDRIRCTTMDRVECRGMGTTIVAAMMLDQTCCIAHVGDSRAYLFRENDLLPVTSDHSWVNEQLKQGFLTAENARNHPFRNVITQALGSGTELKVDLVELSLRDQDVLLLCTDGLNSMLTDQEIGDILREHRQAALDERTMALIEASKDRGGDDNITVALLDIID
jgi:protein phosphatase